MKIGFSPVRVGLVCSEPIRCAGYAFAFEDQDKILIATGLMRKLLANAAMRYMILDVSLERDGISVILEARLSRPDVQLVVIGPVTRTGVGQEESKQIQVRSIAAGARAYLDELASPRMVRRALDGVMDGYIWAPRRVLSILIDELQRIKPAAVTTSTSWEFSPRERQVLDLLLEGYSNRAIAEELGVEERTVKAHVASLFRKTGVDNRVALSMEELRRSRVEKGDVS